VGRRLVLICSLALLASAGPANAAAKQPASWAAPAIRVVSSAGLMGGAKNVAAFHASDALTAQSLEDVVFDLKARLAPPPDSEEPAPIAPQPTTTGPPTTTDTVTTTTTTTTDETPAPKQVANPDRPVPMWELDARLVGALGLGNAAAAFNRGTRAAGLRVPTRFGTEVVARLLGLRLNHPASDDSLELRPQDTATRAEAAYSVAQILQFSDWQIPSVEAAAQSFALPALSDWQQRILDTAVAKIGMPYIWGGTSDTSETEFGVSSRGGYDCSGFVWRVYKLQWYPGEGALPSTLVGRTTYQMSGEVPKPERIALADLQPADVIFFGDRGPRSKPAQVGHMGIYLGNGWFIHSSEYGVALATLTDWYAREFAWGRRPLAEAGLSS
jgi:cell wall-associated NlpC family hydrolase